MATIPNWLLGRHVTTLLIQAQTMDSLGVLAATGSNFGLTGTVDEITLTRRVSSEPITPLTSTAEHAVVIGLGYELTLVQILRVADHNALTEIASTVTGDNSVVSVTFTRGLQSWAGYFRVGDYSEGIRRGKSVATLSLMPVALANGGTAPIDSISFTNSVM